MDNHPIPQDITGFQFKLIGSMTIRQFAYLATGGVLAVLFIFILPIPFLVGVILGGVSFLIGASFAFLPLGGRPMDVMVSNFFKALFAPTQYLYRKKGGNLPHSGAAQTPAIIASNATAARPLSSSVSSTNQVPSITNEFEESLANVPPSPAPQMSPPPLPVTQTMPATPAITASTSNVAEANAASPPLAENIEQSTKAQSLGVAPPQSVQFAPIQKPLPAPVAPSSEQSKVQNLLLETQRQKEALENELTILKQKLEVKKQKNQIIKVREAAEKPASSLSSSLEPNLILGIVKDPRGGPLQNILVEVKDSEENPVRAFKTNEGGQFASATPLGNGKYVLIFEDPKAEHKFDAVEIEAVGTPLPPLEIISIDPREELRRELFN